MERLVLVRCPELLAEDEGGVVLRRFTRVVDVVRSYSPWVTVVRAGICTMPARGPARFFGGVDAVVRLVGGAVGAVDGATAVEVGVADGVFAAHLAARRRAVVPPGATAAFLAPWPVAVLEHPDLVQLLVRLGLRTLGDFAALTERHVVARLGADGLVRHRLARALDGELPGFRQPAVAGRMARLAAVPGPSPSTGPAAGGDDHPGGCPQQAGFWGGRRHADDRAARALAAVQHLVGPDGVQVARCQGGRAPTDRARFAMWAAAARRAEDGPEAPWPGRIPPPAPTIVHRQPAVAALVAATGSPVGVTSRGDLTQPPDRLRVGTGPWTGVVAWAGPWPAWERWWAPDPNREARLQVVTTRQLAHLLAARHDGWRVLATYD